MKEKYFGRIKTIGILLNIIVLVVCICPWKDSFPIVGTPHTIVSYYRLQTAEEIKTSTKIGKSLSSSMEEADFKSLVATASLAMREQGIEKWNKKAQKEWIPALIDGTDIGKYESTVGRDNLEDLLEEMMIKERAKVHRNWGIVKGKEVSSTGDNDYYLSLVIKSLAFFGAILAMAKYGKDSEIGVGFLVLGASIVGAVTNLLGDLKLTTAVKEATWAAGAKFYSIGTILGAVVYASVIALAVVMIIVDLKGNNKVRNA